MTLLLPFKVFEKLNLYYVKKCCARVEMRNPSCLKSDLVTDSTNNTFLFIYIYIFG